MESQDDTPEDDEENLMDFSEIVEDNSIENEKSKIIEPHNYGKIEDVFFHVISSDVSDANCQILIYLPLRTPLYVKGKLKVLRVISGSLECLGNVMTRETLSAKSQDIFSPKGSSLLSLTAFTEGKENSNGNKNHSKINPEIKSDLKCLGIKKEVYKTIISKDGGLGCFFVVAKLDGPKWATTLEQYLPYCASNLKFSGDYHKERQNAISLFGKDFGLLNPKYLQQKTQKQIIEELLNVSIYDSYPEEQAQKVPRLFKSHPDWDLAIISLFKALKDPNNRNPRLLIAGGKGVGKSTFIRYVANRLLTASYIKQENEVQIPSVLFIDLDPGQAEFTIPGCIAATKVAHPVMGPNFSHLDRKKEYCEYLGEINISNIPKSYNDSLLRINNYCENNSELKKIPWLINTMGFSNGLGVKIMSNTLRLFKPGTFVELRSRFQRKNYKTDLRRQVEKARASSSNSCEFFRFNAIPESLEAKTMRSKSLWGIPEPKKLRDISILAYFGQCDPNEPTNGARRNPLRAAIPYVVSWDHVGVQVLNVNISASSIPKIANMSLVGLGHIKYLVKSYDSGQQDPSEIHLASHNGQLSVSSLDLGTKCLTPGAAISIDIKDNSSKESNLSSTELIKDYELKPPILIEPTVVSLNVGFGFVRGIDTEKRLFYIVTPLLREEMQFVNCITVGAVTLPTGVISSQAQKLDKTSNSKVGAKDKKVMNKSRSANNEATSKYHVPYLVTNDSSKSSSSPSVYATPFSAPWQRYSKPKFAAGAPGPDC